MAPHYLFPRQGIVMSSEMWRLECSEPSARKLGPFTKTATQSHKHTVPAPKHSQHHGKGKSWQVDGEEPGRSTG